MKQPTQYMRSVLSTLSITTALLLVGCGSSSSSTASDAPSSEAQTQTTKATVKTPLQDATGIPVDPLFNVVFDTLMDPASINEETVYLVADATDTIVPGTATILDDNKTVVYTTSAALLPGEVYSLVVTTGVEDILGNHTASDLTSVFTVGDAARIVVPVAMPAVGTVLENEAAQFLVSALGSMLGSTEGLPLSPYDLAALSVEELTLNDLLAAVQAQNPAANTVGELLGTQVPLGILLGILSDNLPEGSSALAPLEAVTAQLSAAPGDLLGQTLALGDILTLPAEMLPLDPTSTSAQDALSVVTNPLALLETVAQTVNAGGLVNDPVVGPVIANATTVGGLVMDGGVLTQIPGAAELASLIPLEQLELVNTILASDDPTGVIETILGGGDTVETVDTLLTDLTTDPTENLTDLLSLLGTLGV